MSKRERVLRATGTSLEPLLGLSPALAPVVVLSKSIVDSSLRTLQNKDDCYTLAERVAELATALINEVAGKRPESILPETQQKVDDLIRTLEEIHVFVKGQQVRSFVKRIAKSSSDQKAIVDLNVKLDRSLKAFNLKANIIVGQQLETIRKALETPSTHHRTNSKTSNQGSSSSGSVSGVSRLSSTSSLPAEPAIFFGRDELKQQLVKLLVSSDSVSRIAILGPGGVGKTSLALVALHSSSSKDSFGDRRFFIRCDAATTPQQLLSIIATEIGLSGNDLLAQIVETFESGEGRALLMLDNFESPWDTQGRPQVEEILNKLASIKNLVLVLTLRGSERPVGPPWTRPFLPPLKPLDPISAKLTFEAISDAEAGDSSVSRLLSFLDNLPLAITLMANLAQYETPSVLLERWDTEHTQMLTRGDGKDRLGSLETSINVSLESSRMQQDPHAKTLLGIMAFLPDGVSSLKHLQGLAPSLSQVGRAASTLKQVALAWSDERCHLAVLAPIRSFIRSQHPPPRKCLLDIQNYYIQLAKVAAQLEAGSVGLAGLQLLIPEVGNMQAIFNDALADTGNTTEETYAMIHAVINCTDLFRYSGLGDETSLKHAAAAAKRLNDILLEARCMQQCGELFYARSNQSATRSSFAEALSLFERLDNKSGMGRCILMLGMLESGAGKYKDSAQKINHAQEYFQKANDDLGLADCYLRLAQAAAWERDFGSARTNVDKALEIYKTHSHLRAQARCRWLIGFILFDSRQDLELAEDELNQATRIYHDVGDPTGEGNCQRILGKLQFSRYRLNEAAVCFTKAVEKYHLVKWKFGLADSKSALGNVRYAQYDNEAARVAFREALELYVESDNRKEQGNCLRCLFDVALRMQDFLEAQALANEFEELAQSKEDRARHRCMATRFIAASGIQKVDFEDLLKNLQDALDDLMTETNLDKDRALCLETIGDILKDDEARCMTYGKAKGSYMEGGDMQSVGRVLLKMSRVSANKAQAKEALETFKSIGDSRGCQDSLDLLESM